MIKKMFAAALMLVAFATTSHAAGVGCYVEGAIGASLANTKLGVDTPLGSLASLDGVASTGVAIVPGIGCDYRTDGGIFYGAYTNYDFGKADTKINVFTTSFSAHLQNNWNAGVRVGTALTPTLDGFLFGGFSAAKMDLSSFGTSDLNLHGYHAGAGLQWKWTDVPGLYADAKYSYTKYNGESIALGGPLSLGLDTSDHKVLFGLTYKFGASQPESMK